MVRTQISLENELQRRARRRASDSGVSFAEYVRRLVTRDLALPAIEANVTKVFDLGRSGASNIARDKDSMLSEVFGAGKKRRG